MRKLLLIMMIFNCQLLFGNTYFEEYSSFFKSIGVTKEDNYDKLAIISFPNSALYNCGNDKLNIINKLYKNANTKLVLVLNEANFDKDLEITLKRNFSLDQVIFLGFDEYINDILDPVLKPTFYLLDYKKNEVKCDFGIYGQMLEPIKSIRKTIELNETDKNIALIKKNIFKISKAIKNNKYLYITDDNLNRLLIFNLQNSLDYKVIDLNFQYIRDSIVNLHNPVQSIKYLDNVQHKDFRINNIFVDDNRILNLIISFPYSEFKNENNKLTFLSYIIQFNATDVKNVEQILFDEKFPHCNSFISNKDYLAGTVAGAIDSISINNISYKTENTIGFRNMKNGTDLFISRIDSFEVKDTIREFWGFAAGLNYGFSATKNYIYFLTDIYHPFFLRISLNDGRQPAVETGQEYGINYKYFNELYNIAKIRNIMPTYYVRPPDIKVANLFSNDSVLTVLSKKYRYEKGISIIYLTKYYDSGKYSEFSYVFRNNMEECFILNSDEEKAEILIKTRDNDWYIKSFELK